MYRLRVYPDKCLFKVAQPLNIKDKKTKDKINSIIEALIRIMLESGGVGLAANQIGILKRIIVILQEKPHALINPEIVYQEGKESGEEGCLSLPGIKLYIERHKFIKVRYYDIDYKKAIIEADDLLSRIIQHEIDHLNGILIIDKVNKKIRKECISLFGQNSKVKD